MVNSNSYIPDRGDVVWVDFDPALGREQKGARPAVILSSAHYSKYSSLMVACPLTTSVKGYPFEVTLVFKGKKAAVLSDQIRSVDWRARKVAKAGAVSEEVINEVNAKISALLGNKR